MRVCVCLVLSAYVCHRFPPSTGEVAAQAVLCSADVIKKAAFVAENAVDTAVIHTALGCLINFVCACPSVFLADVEACKVALAAAEKEAEEAAALAVALGACSCSPACFFLVCVCLVVACCAVRMLVSCVRPMHV